MKSGMHTHRESNYTETSGMDAAIRKVRHTKLLFGIKKKAMLSVSLIFGIIFFLTYMGVNKVARENTQEFLTDQYSYLNDKVLGAFETIYDELNLLTADFITNEYVQKTLTNQAMTASDKDMLERTLSYFNNSFLDSYLVIDNKGNLYSQKAVKLDVEKFRRSTIYKSLGEEYSKTKILWTRDVIFGTNEMSFFAVRYIHEMNSVHDAGVLILKLNEEVMEPVVQNAEDEELAYFIMNPNREVCFKLVPKELENTWQQELEAAWAQEGAALSELKHGIVSKKTDGKSQFTVVTYAPGSVSNRTIREIQMVMALIFGGMFILTVLGVAVFADRLTRPIQYLSSAMREFDDSKLDVTVALDTNTELDFIGQAYNKMIAKVKELMNAVMKKEKELKESELQTMLYQIRPHFLYNTLDTIYMLARIQREETIMKMTQSLSKFLRINLSNGRESIEVSQELEHVGAYMDIQKIRNADLFDYEMEAKPGTEHLLVTKMILQPIVENSIKHGFRDIYSGGRIWIRVSLRDGFLCFSIENNGTPIEKDAMIQLNRMEKVTMEEVDKLIERRQGGFGICNVVKRLRLRYNGQIRFYYAATGEGTECVIQIKMEQLESKGSDPYA